MHFNLNLLAKKIKKKLPKSQFAHSVGVLISGTAGAQLLIVLATPLLTRLYSPEKFGLLAVYASILSFLTVISSLRYELAIPLPKSNLEAAHITVLSIIIVIAMTILSIPIIFIFNNEITAFLNIQKIKEYLWFIPFALLFIGIYQVLNYWAIRCKNYSVISKTKIKQSTLSILIQSTFFKFDTLGLILGQIAGQIAGVSNLAKLAIKSKEFKKISYPSLKKFAIKYKKFPLFSTWEGFANTASLQIPPLMFAALFSPSIAGFYMLANRVLALPMSVIGSAIGNVFLTNAATAYRENKLQPLFEKVFSTLTYLSLPIITILLFTSPKLFSFAFGKEWEVAGVYAQWMAVWLGLVFIASPLSTLFSILQKQKSGMIFQVTMLALRILSILIGAFYQNIILTIALFSFTSAGCWLYFIFWGAIKSNSSTIFVIKTFIKAILFSLLSSIPIIIATFWFTKNDFLWWFSFFITGGLILIFNIKKLKEA